jgi:plastocyanin
MTLSLFQPRRSIAVVSVLAGLALAGCGGAPSVHQSTGTTTTSSPSSTVPSSPYPGVDPGHVVPAPAETTTTPREDPQYPIYQNFNTGQQALITAHGFEPSQLDATSGQAVVWTNVSGVAQRVLINQEGVRSAPIAPGAQFVWTWKGGGNINVQSASGFHQSVYYQQ